MIDDRPCGGKTGIALALFAAGLAGAFWLHHSYTSWRDAGLRRHIPFEAEAGEAVHVGGETGIMGGGCGAAVFELTPPVRARLRASGLRALTESMATHSRATGRPIATGWRETPYTGEASRGDDFWAFALSCTWMRAALRKTVDDALESPGAYYRFLDDGAVLVVPDAGIVMYAYFD